MTNDLLHLSDRETIRIVRETPDELEIEATWDPGSSPPPPHFHPAQDEHFEVTSGRLTAVVGGQERQLGPGDTIEILRRTPHKMWNPGNESATAIWRTRPAGRTAAWFRSVDRAGNHGTRKPPFPRLAKLLTEYADVFQLAVGPAPLRPALYVAFRIVGLAGR